MFSLEKHRLKYLRVPLYAQARNRPGKPGLLLNMSNTKYGIYLNKREGEIMGKLISFTITPVIVH